MVNNILTKARIIGYINDVGIFVLKYNAKNNNRKLRKTYIKAAKI